MFANGIVIVACCAIFASTGGCSTSPPKNVTENIKLPLLDAVRIKPVKGTDDFDDSHGFHFPRDPKARYSNEPPFERNDLAVNVAKSWLKEFFEPLPEGASLDVYDNHDAGIALREFIHGVPTGGRAFLEIKNGKVVSAYVGLWKFIPIPNTDSVIVSKDVAASAWRTKFVEKGLSQDQLAEYDRDVAPVLKYVWSPVGYSEWSKEHNDVFSPTWVLGEESLLMVDGHTGKPWYND